MHNKKTIVVDVDLTLVDITKYWHIWLKKNSYDSCLDKLYLEADYWNVDYNLGKYYQMYKDVHPLSFWKQPYIYDDAVLMDDAYDCIKEWYEAGYELVFASFCFAGHMDSKVKMLQREFDFIKEKDFHFVATKSKGTLKCDIMIDDRVSFLNQADKSVDKYLMGSVYRQDEEVDKSKGKVTGVNGWGELRRLVN